MPPEGTRGWEIPRCHPGPSPGAGEGAAPTWQHSTHRQGTERNKALKKKNNRWNQKQKKVPLRLVFPTMIKTSISAAARVSSGIGGREGVAGGVCAP